MVDKPKVLAKKIKSMTNPVITVRKIKEKKSSSFVVMTKGNHGSEDKAETIKFDEEFIQGTILGGDKRKVDYDSISEDNKIAMIRTWGSVDRGIEALRNLTLGEFQNVFTPMVELQKQMQSISKHLNPLREQQQQLRAKLNPLMKGKNLRALNFASQRSQQKIRDEISTSPNFKGINNWGNSGIMSLFNSKYLDRGVPDLKATKADGAKRRALTGTGMNRIMTKHKLNNPVMIAKVYPKKPKDLNISGFLNLRFLCEQMNVNAEEAFLYICEGMTSNETRWLNHKVIKELARGSLGIVNLVGYFDDKNKQHKASNKAKFSIKSLYTSNYYEEWCVEYDVKKMSYTDFTKKFKKFQKSTKEYHEKNPKGLLG